MDGEDQHLSPERPRIVVGGDWIGVPVDDLPLDRYHRAADATILALEHWRARIGDGSSVEAFGLRVTTTFRRENAEELVQTHQRESTIFDPVIAPPRREATGVHPTTQACVLVLSAVFVRQAGEPDLLSSS